MSQRQFRSDDTSPWTDKYGTGSNGAYTPSSSTDSPVDSACTGTSGAVYLSATNTSFAPGQLVLVHQTQGTGAGQWELNRIDGYTAGTITTSYPLIYSYSLGAQVLVMPQYSSGNIAGGVTATVKAWNGTVGGIYAKFCNGGFTIAGTINGTGVGFAGNASGNGEDSGGYAGVQGNSSTGNGVRSQSANGMGGGGGLKQVGGPRAPGGGGGGHATAGSNGVAGATGGNAVGTGGAIGGNTGLTSMMFGGAGGGGGANSTNQINPSGGNSGAIVFIISKNIPTITGAINVNGSNGVNATNSDNAGGGAGAGGSVLLKGQSIDIGTNKITVAAGTAGNGSGGSGAGGDGSVGRIHVDYSQTISGSTSPTVDTRLDTALNDVGGGFFFNFV